MTVDPQNLKHQCDCVEGHAHAIVKERLLAVPPYCLVACLELPDDNCVYYVDPSTGERFRDNRIGG